MPSTKEKSRETFDSIYQRRSVKAFDPKHRLSHDEVEKLLTAAIQSPTSFNIQHWRFVVVSDSELRTQIRAVGNDQAQMTDASLLVLMTADIRELYGYQWHAAMNSYVEAVARVSGVNPVIVPALAGGLDLDGRLDSVAR